MRSETWARVLTVGATVALTALGGQSVADARQGVVVGAGGANAIEGSYIVVLRDDVSTHAKAKVHAAKYDAEITRIYTSALHGYAAKLTEPDAKELAGDSSVVYVEQDRKVSVAADQLNPPSWGLDRVDQRDLPLDAKYSYSSTAADVTAYIIDTGIRTSHQDFGGRATWATNTAGDGVNTDCHGHGTHVAGTVGGAAHGLAKAVKLKAVKVLDCDGFGSYAGIVAGVDWVTANAQKPAVANMSLGGPGSRALDDSVLRSIRSGVTYAVAAGNGNSIGQPVNACGASPARIGGLNAPAITVMAATGSDTPTEWSNYGPCTDLYAPGLSITSAWSDSNTAIKTISGTSMATPHVAGAAALYLSGNTAASPRQVKDHLVGNASSGRIGNVPIGTPNKLLYTGTSPDTTPPPPPDCTSTNGTDTPIPDAGPAVTSSITISGCNRTASSVARILIDIKHTWRGDLFIDVITPTGAAVNLKVANASDGTDNVHATFTRDLSDYPADGTWKLLVRDAYTYDTGYLDSWSITV